MYNRPPFQLDQPVFVAKPFNSGGKKYDRGDEFIWRTRGVDQKTAQLLYDNLFLYHDPEREKELAIGDGLEQLTMAQLKNLAKELNKRADRLYPNKYGTKSRFCKITQSETDKAKQIALIRQARHYAPPDIEDGIVWTKEILGDK